MEEKEKRFWLRLLTLEHVFVRLCLQEETKTDVFCLNDKVKQIEVSCKVIFFRDLLTEKYPQLSILRLQNKESLWNQPRLWKVQFRRKFKVLVAVFFFFLDPKCKKTNSGNRPLVTSQRRTSFPLRFETTAPARPWLQFLRQDAGASQLREARRVPVRMDCDDNQR